jgi:glycosyltransferase involved in cell wall biosynthesis
MGFPPTGKVTPAIVRTRFEMLAGGSVSSVRRFALVTANYYPRVCGIGDFSARFATELRRAGHDVALFSRNPARRNPEAPEVEVHGVDGRLPMIVAQNLAAQVGAFRPTEVLIQYTSQMWDAWRFGSLAPLALAWQARRAGARVTLVAHELALRLVPRPDLALAASAQRLQLGALLKLCDRTFVTTTSRADRLAAACRLLGVRAPGVVRVGANALPVGRRRPRDASSPPRLGIFSTAAVGKRFDVLLEAFESIARAFPAAELVLIGELGPPSRPSVKQVLEGVARHPAKDRIRLTGSLSLAEVAQEIADLDLYLFPMDTGANSRSSTLPSALGSSLPTIAVRGEETDLALFRDGENIVFARDLSGPAFADAALRLLRDPQLMGRLGEGARRLYDEHLSWEGTVRRFLAER